MPMILWASLEATSLMTPFLLLVFQEQQRACKAIEHSTSWFRRPAFPNPLCTKWLESIQILLMEAALVLLEKSLIQYNTYHAYACRVFALWDTVLEARKRTVSQLT